MTHQLPVESLQAYILYVGSLQKLYLPNNGRYISFCFSGHFEGIKGGEYFEILPLKNVTIVLKIFVRAFFSVFHHFQLFHWKDFFDSVRTPYSSHIPSAASPIASHRSTCGKSHSSKLLSIKSRCELPVGMCIRGFVRCCCVILNAIRQLPVAPWGKGMFVPYPQVRKIAPQKRSMLDHTA